MGLTRYPLEGQDHRIAARWFALRLPVLLLCLYFVRIYFVSGLLPSR